MNPFKIPVINWYQLGEKTCRFFLRIKINAIVYFFRFRVPAIQIDRANSEKYIFHEEWENVCPRVQH